MHKFIIPPTWSSASMLNSTPFPVKYSASTRCIFISMTFLKNKKQTKKNIVPTTWQAWNLGMRPTHLKSFPVRSFPGICNVICFICHHSRTYLLPCSYSLVISGWQAKSNPLVPYQWTLASFPKKSFLSQDVTYFSYPNFLYILDVTTLIL